MPKKTKRQKLLAEYRRKIKQLEKKEITTSFIEKKDFSSPSLLNKNKTVQKKITEKETGKNLLINKKLDIETLFFAKDIKKSLIITLLILILEFSLYLAKIKNYINLF